MKKIIFLLIGVLSLLLPGCVGLDKAPLFEEGVYPLHAKTFTYLELASDQPVIKPNMANLTQTKPDYLSVDFDDSTMAEVTFGSFRLGNNEQKIWFVMGRDPLGNWSDFYIDQNLDYHLTMAEKVKNLQTGQGEYKGYHAISTFVMAPVTLQVSYKGSARCYTKKLSFFIEILDLMKNDVRDTFVKAYSAGFFEGQIPVRIEKTTRLFQFRLVDADSNGCFNDYGKDMVYMDLNHDGFFRNNEGYPLVEYFGSNDLQRQITVPPYPAKLAVTKVNEDLDITTLESGTDPATPAEPNNAAAAKVPEGEKAAKGDGK